MAKVQLRVQKIKTGEQGTAEFDSVDEARAWLTQRPKFMEVTGVNTSHDDETERSLRSAMRSLDDEERAAVEAFHEAQRERMRREAEEENRQELERLGLNPDAKGGDPDRWMVLEWHEGKPLRNCDPTDDREIPEVARRAVEAWVAQRDEWLHPGGQRVGAATLTVWPDRIPSGDEKDRIEPGGEHVAVPGARDKD